MDITGYRVEYRNSLGVWEDAVTAKFGIVNKTELNRGGVSIDGDKDDNEDEKNGKNSNSNGQSPAVNVVEELEPNSTYIFRVSALNHRGIGDFSDDFSIKVRPLAIALK